MSVCVYVCGCVGVCMCMNEGFQFWFVHVTHVNTPTLDCCVLNLTFYSMLNLVEC